jgi:hypothetical protein
MCFQEKAVRCRLPKSVGATVVIPFTKGAALGLVRTAAGFQGTFILLGKQRRKATKVFELLAAYQAANHARMLEVEGKPKAIHIVGLEFTHERHVETVASHLERREFPALIAEGESRGGVSSDC